VTRQAKARFVLGFALALVGLLAVAGPAQARTEGFKYSFSFSQPGPHTELFGFGMGLGIDQSNGDVYVTEAENHRLLKFDSAGNFLQAWGYGVSDGAAHSEVCTAPAACQVGIAGTAPGQFFNPTSMAVDNSSGPNQGDVYVVDGPSPYAGSGNPGAILKFSSSGTYLGKIDGAESDTGVFKALGWMGGVSVDENGFVWVAGGPVSKYSNESDNEFVPGSQWSCHCGSEVWSVTANGNGTRLLVGGYGNGGGEGPYVTNASGTLLVDHLPCGGYLAGGTAFDPVTGNFLVGTGGEICEFTQKGVSEGRFGGGGLSSSYGIDVNATNGDVYVADMNAGAVRVFEPRIVPDVTTGDPTDVGRTTATLTGEAAPDPTGGGDVSGCHFEIGTDTSYGTNVPCVPATPYSTATPVTADVSSLTAETTYHYRLVAANSIDSAVGGDKTFTPHAVTGLRTDAGTDITQISATINGSFEPNGEVTHVHFEWGPDSSYGNVTPNQDVNGTPAVRKGVSAPITGLESFHAYHYRVVAQNGLGISYGEDEVVRMAPPDFPDVSAPSISDLTDHSALISGVVNPGRGETSYGVEYSLDTSFRLEEPGSETVGSTTDNSDHPIAVELSELLPGTTYHLRVVATNFTGTTHGSELTFTTLAVPTIVSADAAAVTQTTATLTALVTPNLSPTTFHFEYGPGGDYGSATRESPSIGADEAGHELAVPLSGLAPGTTYHFRIVATNAIGAAASSDHSFTTASVPAPPPAPPVKCKTGFVKRNGHCVKRHKAQRKHRSHSRRGGNR
jgi:phosphodiesterase/alkaline phosphatase D-like protein